MNRERSLIREKQSGEPTRHTGSENPETRRDFLSSNRETSIRFFSALFLLVLVAALGLLAYENNHDTVLNAWTWRLDVPLPLLLAGVYALGMLSGWWLIGLMKRSWQRVTEPDRARA